MSALEARPLPRESGFPYLQRSRPLRDERTKAELCEVSVKLEMFVQAVYVAVWHTRGLGSKSRAAGLTAHVI